MQWLDEANEQMLSNPYKGKIYQTFAGRGLGLGQHMWNVSDPFPWSQWLVGGQTSVGPPNSREGNVLSSSAISGDSIQVGGTEKNVIQDTGFFESPLWRWRDFPYRPPSWMTSLRLPVHFVQLPVCILCPFGIGFYICIIINPPANYGFHVLGQ